MVLLIPFKNANFFQQDIMIFFGQKLNDFISHLLVVCEFGENMQKTRGYTRPKASLSGKSLKYKNP